MPRINKYIASTGYCSRRKADELIREGRVKVNDKVISELGFYVREKDRVYIDNKFVKPLELQYYRFYKPAGYITTSDDEKGRRTIYDLLPENLHHLKPVGRLDRESTGLIILTNDGDLINSLTHPSVKVPKLYRVSIKGKISQNDIDTMYKGIEIEKGKIAYAQVDVLEIDNNSTVMEILLYQGMNRQIRKMLEYLGYEVVTLKRIQHAIFTLDGLKRGEFKPIKPGQIKDLRNFLKRLESQNA
jgi:23S rRNA pseudouridine2605 synthase